VHIGVHALTSDNGSLFSTFGIVLYGIIWYYMVLYCIIWYYIVLYGITFNSIIVEYRGILQT
jgi:hypothetical protein